MKRTQQAETPHLLDDMYNNLFITGKSAGNWWYIDNPIKSFSVAQSSCDMHCAVDKCKSGTLHNRMTYEQVVTLGMHLLR